MRLALVGIALLAAGGLFAGLRYQPLQRVGTFTAGNELDMITVEGFEQAGTNVVRYTDGDYVTYAFTVRNTGPLGVTVTDVPFPPETELRMLQPVSAGLAGSASADAEDMRPFEPFSLDAGGEQRVIVQARLDNCEYYTERAVETLAGQALTYRVLGLTRTAEIAFDRPLLVRSPVIQRCPERTLDRSENRRTEP